MPRGGGGGTRQKFWEGGSGQAWKMDPIGSDRFQKRGSIGLEIWKNGSIGLNIKTMRGQADRAWLFERFGDAEKGTQSDWKSQKRGSSQWTSLPCPSMGVHLPGIIVRS